MAENTNTEREAFEDALIKLCAGFGEEIGESDLDRTPSGAYVNGSTEVAWMLWQARASLSLPAAGQEPVAPDWWRTRANEIELEVARAGSTEAMRCFTDMRTLLQAVAAAPQPAVAAGWVMVDERLPDPGKPVLLDIGKKLPIRAMWAAKHTVQAADDDTDWGEYDEATDAYYAPEGWYEWNQHEETNWAVTETPRAWCELPQPLPPAPSTEGEGNG